MITLGVGELVAAMALMFPGFFGGRRRHHHRPCLRHSALGLRLRPSHQVYYLIAVYCFHLYRR